MIADDVLRVVGDGDRWLAQPDGEVLRLWPDAAALLFGDADRLPRITASWDKRALRLGQYDVSPADRPVPLGAIAFLETANRTARTTQIIPLQAADALVRLVVNSSATHLLDISQRAAEFGDFASLAQSTRCAALLVSQNASEPDQLCDRLIDWARGGATEAVR